MPNNNKWVAALTTRVLSHALLGGLLTALVGALCIGAAGAAVGYVLDLASTPATWSGGFMAPGGFLGLYLGSWSGILGALIFGVAAATAGPGRCFKAFYSLCARVTLGQVLGTLGALSFYFAYAWVVAQTKGQPFIGTVEDNADLIMWGAPTLMMCGALAGALWKRSGRARVEVEVLTQ